MPRLLALLALLLFLIGCRSRVVNVTISNNSSAPLHNIEVVYSGGSYGISHLEPGKTHQYPIKPFAPATMEISYTDASGTQQKRTGPRLVKDDLGQVNITIDDKELKWSANVQHK